MMVRVEVDGQPAVIISADIWQEVVKAVRVQWHQTRDFVHAAPTDHVREFASFAAFMAATARTETLLARFLTILEETPMTDDAQAQCWKTREAALLQLAGAGFVIDDESMACDWCGARIPHQGDVADYVTDRGDNVLCRLDATKFEDAAGSHSPEA